MDLIYAADELAKLFVMFATVAGVAAFATGLYGFVKNAKQPGSYPTSTSIASMFVGFLLMVPTALYEIIAASAVPSYSGHSDPLAVAPHLLDMPTGEGTVVGQIVSPAFVTGTLAFIMLFGLGTFLRGIYCFRYAGHPSPPGNNRSPVWRGCTFVIAGMLLFNVKELLIALNDWFGLIPG